MSALETFYDLSPLGVQNLMTTLSGYQRNRSRYGKIYWDHRAFLKEFDRWPAGKQLEYQREELVKLLRYTVKHSAFYRELYAGIDLSQINSVDDLKRLPIVDKEMIRERIDDVATVEEKGAVIEHTGGTTGKSLIVRHRAEDTMRRMATLDHFKARVGFEHRQMKRATFNGKHIVPPGQKSRVFWRYNRACRQMIYSSFFLSETNIPFYIESLNRFKPDALDGFFTCLVDIAGYMKRKGITPQFHSIAIFPTSETLTPDGRVLLEEVFQCKVYDQYASSEYAPFVTECPEQTLHVELSSGVFEKMPDSDEVLVTSFASYGTPLIRYRIGDKMIFAGEGETCACGLHSPVIRQIEGRSLDFLYTPEGAKINAGNVANLLKNMPNAVIRAQFRQDTMDHIKALLQVDPELYKEDYDQLLIDEFAHKFGEKTRVTIEHVPEIPRETSGKYRMIVNHVNP